jgi:hypothetical protein
VHRPVAAQLPGGLDETVCSSNQRDLFMRFSGALKINTVLFKVAQNRGHLVIQKIAGNCHGTLWLQSLINFKIHKKGTNKEVKM